MAKTTQHIVISGKVQGVGFRNYVLELAMVDELQGWVRNLKDGRVEALVQGVGEKIDHFIGEVKKGPNPIARVADVEVNTYELEEELEKFNITEDGEEQWSNY